MNWILRDIEKEKIQLNHEEPYRLPYAWVLRHQCSDEMWYGPKVSYLDCSNIVNDLACQIMTEKEVYQTLESYVSRHHYKLKGYGWTCYKSTVHSCTKSLLKSVLTYARSCWLAGRADNEPYFLTLPDHETILSKLDPLEITEMSIDKKKLARASASVTVRDDVSLEGMLVSYLYRGLGRKEYFHCECYRMVEECVKRHKLALKMLEGSTKIPLLPPLVHQGNS